MQCFVCTDNVSRKTCKFSKLITSTNTLAVISLFVLDFHSHFTSHFYLFPLFVGMIVRVDCQRKPAESHRIITKVFVSWQNALEVPQWQCITVSVASVTIFFTITLLANLVSYVVLLSSFRDALLELINLTAGEYRMRTCLPREISFVVCSENIRRKVLLLKTSQTTN
jgi:hypothetical protein